MSWIAAPLFTFLGAAPDDTLARLGGTGRLTDFWAPFIALPPDQARWVLVVLGDLAFAVGLICFAYIFLTNLRMKQTLMALDIDGEHTALHEQIYKEQEDLRQKMAEERLNMAAVREELAHKIQRVLERISDVEKMEEERGDLMQAVQRMLTQVSDVGKIATPQDKLHDAARKRLEDIRREIIGE